MKLLLLLAFGTLGFSQDLPTSWAGAGALHSGSTLSGYTTYAKLCTAKPCVAAQGLYSYSGYQVMWVGGKPVTVADSGGALLLRQWRVGGLGSLFILGFGTVGITSGATLGLSGSGGGVGVFQLGKSSFTFQGSYRQQVVNGTSVPVVGFGFGKVL